MKAEISRNRIALNIITSVISVIIVGLVYFILYRVMIRALGAEMVGIWSLIIATTSVSSLANFGFTSALVKFVAEYRARGESSEISKLLFTSIISVSISFLLITIIVYALAVLFIDQVVDSKYVSIAMEILPLSLLCLSINSISGLLTSTLEGHLSNYVKNIIYSFTTLCYLGFSLLFISSMGLTGIALAQLIQSVMILAISYICLKRNFQIEFFKWNWSNKIFRDLLDYGYKVQVISISQMLIDPVTKILISKYSGLNTLGFYEMANKMISQFRQIIVSITQVTIPIVSHYNEKDKSQVQYVYKRGISFIIFVIFPLACGIFILTPYISKFWIGNIEPVFINCTYIITLSLLVNILCTPAFFNSFGEGNLTGVLRMNIIVVTLNLILGLILGRYIHVYGVVLSWGLSAALGSVFLIYFYHSKNKITISSLLKGSDYIMIVVAVAFMLMTLLIFSKIGEKMNYNYLSLSYLLIIYLFFFIPAALINKNFRLLNIFQFFKS